MTNKELTKIREEKNMTKGQFAALIGISPMMQGRYEGGKVKIPEDVVEKVMKLGEKEKVEGKKVEKKAKATEKKNNKKPATATKKKTPEKKTTKKKTTKNIPTIHIESMLGGTITIEEIKKRVPENIEAVYIKPEENKAYWVKGDETGDVDLW